MEVYGIFSTMGKFLVGSVGEMMTLIIVSFQRFYTKQKMDYTSTALSTLYKLLIQLSVLDPSQKQIGLKHAKQI